MGTSIYEDERVRLTLWRNVGVSTWFDAPLMEQLVQLRAFANRLHRDFPDGYSFFSVARSGKPNFSADVRAETVAITRDTAPWTFVTAHVVLLDGMVGIAVRSFLQTMLLLSRAPANVKVFGDMDTASRFALDAMGEAGPPLEDMVEALEAMTALPDR